MQVCKGSTQHYHVYTAKHCQELLHKEVYRGELRTLWMLQLWNMVGWQGTAGRLWKSKTDQKQLCHHVLPWSYQPEEPMSTCILWRVLLQASTRRCRKKWTCNHASIRKTVKRVSHNTPCTKTYTTPRTTLTTNIHSIFNTHLAVTTSVSTNGTWSSSCHASH